MSLMNRILITAFDAFGSNAINPSQQLLDLMDGSFIKVVLPTVYGEAEGLLIDTLERVKPRAVVLLGYSKTARPIKIERFARNRDSSIAKDNRGQLGKQPIIQVAPEKLESTFPIHSIEQVWNERGIAFKVSENAGGFLCNHTLYIALHWLAARNLEVPCGFIHVGGGARALVEGHKAITGLIDLLEAQSDLDKARASWANLSEAKNRL